MSFLGRGGQVLDRRLQRQAITVRPESGNDAQRDVAEKTFLPEWLPRCGVAHVYFQKRCPGGQQGIAQGDGGVGKRGRVEQDQIGAIVTAGMDSLQQLVLRIALITIETVAGFFGQAAQFVLDVRERTLAVEVRLPLPQQVQVGISGRTIAPKVYLAVGIRGAFNHTVGLQRAGVIISVNQNRRAVMFRSSDFGIVGAWEEFLPPLIEQLRPILLELNGA